MSEIPADLLYTKEHEWIRMDGDIATIGITDHAQDALTDIVYIELPEGGEMLDDMGEFAIVESVKSASPIFAPLAGEITEVNMDLEDTPELMNTSPYGDGWIVKMKLSNPDDVSTLMFARCLSEHVGRVKKLTEPTRLTLHVDGSCDGNQNVDASTLAGWGVVVVHGDSGLGRGSGEILTELFGSGFNIIRR